MKILFIWPRPYNVPPVKQDVTQNIFYKISMNFFSIQKPLTFPILAALTPDKNSIELIDEQYQCIDFNKEYDLIAISCMTYNALRGYEIADSFKKQGISVVMGGWHPSALPEEAKQHADSVVIGEAEETWPQFLKDLENKESKPFYYPQRPVDPKLIPHPKNIFTKGTKLAVQASRGCPYGCKFCAITNMKYRNIYRMRPIENVIKDIELHTGKMFIFQDPSSTINLEYTKKLFSAIKSLNLKFCSYGNIEILASDNELLKLASEAGCIRWFIGFESISQKTLDNMSKSINRVEKYISDVKKIHDFGMTIDGGFIFGFDDDTLDVFKKTDEFIRKSEIESIDPSILTPLPGTPIYQQFENEGRIITKDWNKYDFDHVVFQPKNMTPEELQINTFELRNKYHSFSDIIKRTIKTIPMGWYPFVDVTFRELNWKLSSFFSKSHK